MQQAGSLVSQLIGTVPAAPVSRENAAFARAQLASARELSRQYAPLLGVSPAEVFDELTQVPDNMLALLNSPEGWAALASYIAIDLGDSQPFFAPTVH